MPLGFAYTYDEGGKTLKDRYTELVDKCLTQGSISTDDIRWILSGKRVELLPLLQAAYRVRYRYFKNRVKVHILNNVQSGNCTEDCRYCAQSYKSPNKIDIYPMKNDEDILESAGHAYASGAYRHCMVFSGRDLGRKRIENICRVVKKIKAKYPMEICVSAGFLTKEDARELRQAGVDRYNHNLNTSRNYYGNICTSHNYRQRVATITVARQSGMDICSGVIIGMGERYNDIIQMTEELKAVRANSIPVNFFIPVDGHRISNYQKLTPQYCLKVLSVFRFAVPKAEIRAAAGREYHLRSQQALCLYAANSIFAKGYLTIGGDDIDTTRQMIEDSGFEIEKLGH
jgi:biotin synthase